MPLPANLPLLSWGVTVIQLRPRDRGAVCRLWCLDREGESLTLGTWEWPSGRPTPSQLEDLLAATMSELGASIVARVGVQGVLQT